jgi:hypothetical protein
LVPFGQVVSEEKIKPEALKSLYRSPGNKKNQLAISGKYRNIFFSEAIALIEPKLCINHWKIFYKLCVFYVDRNSKMTTTANIFPIGSNVKLSPAVAAILNFISEQKT